jgi:hypothetical protein
MCLIPGITRSRTYSAARPLQTYSAKLLPSSNGSIFALTPSRGAQDRAARALKARSHRAPLPNPNNTRVICMLHVGVSSLNRIRTARGP